RAPVGGVARCAHREDAPGAGPARDRRAVVERVTRESRGGARRRPGGRARPLRRGRPRGGRLRSPLRTRRAAPRRGARTVIEFLALPFLACLVLTAIHVYLGLHVLARGVIFVDLALAQTAALGITVALLAGHAIQSDAAYWYALVFTLAGAGLLAVSRTHRGARVGLRLLRLVRAGGDELGAGRGRAPRLLVPRRARDGGRAAHGLRARPPPPRLGRRRRGERRRARGLLRLGPPDRRRRGHDLRRVARRGRAGARGARARPRGPAARRLGAPLARRRRVRPRRACRTPRGALPANGPCLARLDRGAPARRRARVPHAAGARDVPRRPPIGRPAG